MNPPSLVLFDGVCTLCNASVRWIIRHDPERDGVVRFRFASLQSEAGRQALAAAMARPSPANTEQADSMVLIEYRGSEARAWFRSDAVLRVARGLGLPWSLAVAALVVPRPLRDALYRWLARNRYRWFGKQDECMLPTPALRARFADAEERAPRAEAAS